MHLQRLKLVRQTLKKQMYLQESIVLAQDQGHMRCNRYPLHNVTYASAEIDVAMSYGIGVAFTWKYSIWPLTLTSQDVDQYPLHHVTFAQFT